ncbi:hypothetical protein [Psychromonas sp.]
MPKNQHLVLHANEVEIEAEGEDICHCCYPLYSLFPIVSTG